MFRSLWFKLVGAFALVVLVTLVVISSVVIRVTERELSRFTQARTDFAETLIPTIPPIPVIPSFEIREGPPVEITVTEDENTETIVVGPRIEIDPQWREIVIEAAKGGATNRQFLLDVQRAARASILVAGIVSVVLGTILFRQITRPLADLRTAVTTFAQGDLSVRIPIKSKDEVGKVGEAFNQMATELERNEKLRQQMVADVAHELRTPLSVMQSNLEAMLDGLLVPNDGELTELHGEVGRLTRLVEDLRLLSLADAGQLQLTVAALDVGKLVERVIGLMTPLANSHSVQLTSNTPLLPVVLSGDKDKLQQALTNLIENGIRHTPAGGQVTVDVAHTQAQVFISVADTGPGLPTADLPHVFERFWRGDKSRSRHSGGSGLGLSIVKQIAELHGGTVQVVSPETGGTQFTISLPLVT